MAYLTTDCPKCGAEQIGMPVFGVQPANPSIYDRDYRKWFAFAGAYCGRCLTPFGMKVTSKKERNIGENDASLSHAFGHNLDVLHTDLNWHLITIQAPREALEHLPPKVAKALSQADDNLARPGCEEPAAVFYGRAIELSLKHTHPSVTGTLAQRIKTLAANRIIPQSMSDWAEQVRVVRNDGAHDDGVSRADVEAARDFTDAFLRYLITMPALVEARRPAPVAPTAP